MSGTARYIAALIVAPILVCLGLFVIDIATRGWTLAADPEGIAFLIAFVPACLPGLLIGLICADYVLRSFAEFSAPIKAGLASLAGMVGSCIGSGLVFIMLASPFGSREFFPGLLIFPSLFGIVGGLLLAFFSWRRNASDA